MVIQNPLEELLYSSSPFDKLKEKSKKQKQHPYQYGLYLSINHNTESEYEVFKQYDKIYRIFFSNATDLVIHPSDVHTLTSIPREKKVEELMRRNIPLMTSSLHKFEYKKKLSDGRIKRGFYFHSHHHFYDVRPIMRADIKSKIEDLRKYIQEYIPTTSQRHLLVKVQPTGGGNNINDRIDRESYYEYLNTPVDSLNRNLITYFTTQSPVQCDSSLRFTYTD